MKKKIVALLMAAVCAMLATACGSDAAETAGTETAETETAEAEAAEAEATETETAEAEAAVTEEAAEAVSENAEAVSENAEPEMAEDFMPSDFLQERVGRDVFSSYDEVIGLLEKDNGYAKVEVKGYDGEVLLITDYTYDNLDGNIATIQASVYTLEDGNVKNVGNVMSYGTAYPLSIKDGIIYCAGNHAFDTCCISSDTHAVMMMTSIMEDFDTNGNPSYTGFIREDNSLSDDGKEVEIDSQEDFYKYFDLLQDTEIINFTVVE